MPSLIDLRDLLRSNLVALVSLGLLAVVGVAVTWESSPPTRLTARVTNFGLVEQKGYGVVGSVVRAFAELLDGRQVNVVLPNGESCRVGAHIDVWERHALLGSKFSIGPAGCTSSSSGRPDWTSRSNS